jgi:hypothetical protein
MRSHPMIASSWSNTWWTLSRYHKLQCAYCQQISRSISKMVLWAFLAIWWLTGPGKSSLAQTLTNNNGLMTCFHMNWWTMMTYELLMINLTFPGPPVFPAKWLSSWLPRFRKTAEEGSVEPAEGCWCTSGMGWSSAFFKGAPKLVFGNQKHHVGAPFCVWKDFQPPIIIIAFLLLILDALMSNLKDAAWTFHSGSGGFELQVGI